MKIEIYGTPTCGYCKRAITVCEANELEYTYTDVQQDEKQRQLLAERIAPKPLSTVPQIFVDDEHVGGFTEFYKLIQDNT